jgi:hypothetical protein
VAPVGGDTESGDMVLGEATCGVEGAGGVAHRRTEGGRVPVASSGECVRREGGSGSDDDMRRRVGGEVRLAGKARD